MIATSPAENVPSNVPSYAPSRSARIPSVIPLSLLYHPYTIEESHPQMVVTHYLATTLKTELKTELII